MRSTSIATTLALGLAFATAGTALAAEHHVPCTTLPAAVQSKSHEVAAGATVRGCVQDTAAGKTTYEVEMTAGGRGRDVTFSPSGEVLEVEQEVAPASLPPAVSAAFQKAAGTGSVGKVESLSRRGTLVSYEGVVTRGGHHVELAFSPTGAPMKAD